MSAEGFGRRGPGNPKGVPRSVGRGPGNPEGVPRSVGELSQRGAPMDQDRATWGCRRLGVRYGATLALEEVTFEVAAGAVAAVVGGDGAGKTTLLRALAGTVRPAAGTVRRPPVRRLGYVSAGPGVWADLTVDENLRFSGRAYGLDPEELGRRVGGLLERTGLDAARDRLAGQLSGGMRQKLALVMAVAHEPELLVLDEPTTGVDPVSRAELWRLLTAAAAGGAAVVVATTYLDEAERAASVLVLDRGRSLLAGTPEEVVAATPGLVVEATARPEGLPAWRRGARWRAWAPRGSAPPGAAPITPDLEDAVIVAQLREERRWAA
jgi:ABC-2 type transport system ATP-binding protein